MDNKDENKIELEEINNNNDKKNKSEIVSKGDEVIEKDKNKLNIYFIFSINKSIFDKKEISFSLLMDESQKTNLIKFDEINEKKNKLINQLYCISFDRPLTNNKIKTHLLIKLEKKDTYTRSIQIEMPKKNIIFYMNILLKT